MDKEEFESFLIGCSEIGFGKTHSDVIVLVQKLLHSRGIERDVSSGLRESFL